MSQKPQAPIVFARPDLLKAVERWRRNLAHERRLAPKTVEAYARDDEQFLMNCTRTDRLFQLATPLKSRIMGSAAYHICKVADGTALAGIEASPKVWDLAAAWLIVKEAGGAIMAVSGEAIFPLPAERRDYRTRSFVTLTAANPAIMQHLVAATQEQA